MKKIIKKLFPKVYKSIEIDAVDNLLYDVWMEQTHFVKRNFERAYEDKQGKVWIVDIKLKI